MNMVVSGISKKVSIMTMIALSIPKDITKKLIKLKTPKGEKTPEDKMHITLFYFEKQLKPKEISCVFEILYDEMKDLKKFKLSTDHIENFPCGEDGVPIIVRINSDELKDWRAKVAKKLDRKGIKYSKKFDYNPHLTLAYCKTEIEKTKIDKIKFCPETVFLVDNLEDDYEHEVSIIEFPFHNTKSASSNTNTLLKGFLKLI